MRAAIGLIGALSTACISYAEPGRFEPRAPAEAPAASALVVAHGPWTGGRESGEAEAFGASMRAHLAAARLFGGPESPAGHGTRPGSAQPQLLLTGALRCGYTPDTGGLAGPQASGPHVIPWALLTLVGVPTDWATAYAQLVLVAEDAASGVPLWTWDSGPVEETAYAGLYYHPAPLADALRIAADRLEAEVRASLPALEARVAEVEAWSARAQDGPLEALVEALAHPDAAIRGRALVAIAARGPASRSALGEASRSALGEAARSALGPSVLARATDAEPAVRLQVIATVEALGDHAADARAVVGALRRDAAPPVREAAEGASERLRRRADAAALADAALAESAALLADREADARVRGLEQLAARGAEARPAAPLIARALATAAEPREARAAVAALLAAGALGSDIEAALGDAARSAGELGREASLALARLRATGAASPAIAAGAPDTGPATPPAAVAPAAEPRRPVVAVFELEGGSLTPARRAELTGLLSAHLTARARFKVVPHGRALAQIQAAKADSYRSCYDTACQIEVGKAVAAEMIVTTKLIEQPRGCVLSSTLYDLRTEATERAAVVEGPCAWASLTAMLERAADGLGTP